MNERLWTTISTTPRKPRIDQFVLYHAAAMTRPSPFEEFLRKEKESLREEILTRGLREALGLHPVSPVPPAFTQSATSSGRTGTCTSEPAAATAAFPPLKQRSSRSGDPLKYWMEMMATESPSDPTPTSTDSPDERP